MKRIVLFVLIFVMLGSACAENGSVLQLLLNKADVDYMNAHVEVEPMPELPFNATALFYDEGKCLLIPHPTESAVPCLYDIAAGEIVELSALEEDNEVWRGMIGNAARMQNIDISDAEISELVEAKGVVGAFFSVGQRMAAFYNYTAAGSNILVTTNGFYYMVDTAGAVIRPANGGLALGGGSSILWSPGDTGYTVCGSGGSEKIVQFPGDPGYDFCVNGIDVAGDAVAYIVRDVMLNMSAPNPHAVGFMDGYMGADECNYVSIGGYQSLRGPDSVLACGQNKAIVYSRTAAMVNPAILACRDDGMAYALYMEGTALNAVPVEECIDADGFVVMPEGKTGILPLGVSNDGRYVAVLAIDTQDILMVDLDTFETNVLLAYSDASEKGIGSLQYLMCWDGDYINGIRDYVLKVVFE